MLFKDENLGEDMVDILRNLYEWVPDSTENGEEFFHRVPVVGDQKTMECGFGGGGGGNSQSAMHTQNRDAWKGYSSS